MSFATPQETVVDLVFEVLLAQTQFDPNIPKQGVR